ncbi:hypothetical protein MRB53_038124 [Persea americana]|nr:hypothetical protein MRB53_038124 [Persea americana]
MFSSQGLFRGIICPDNGKCDLPNCIFKHEDVLAGDNVVKDVGESLRPGKRRKLGPDESVDTSERPAPTSAGPQLVGSQPFRESSSEAVFDDDDLEVLPPQPTVSASTASVKTRAISPPAVRRPTASVNAGKPSKSAVAADQKSLSLNPRKLMRDPVGHQLRTVYLKKLHEDFVRLNNLVKQSEDAEVRKLRLEDNELVQLALNEEENIAVESFQVYNNVIKLRLLAYKRMSLTQWITLRSQAQKTRNGCNGGAKAAAQSVQGIETGLSESQEMEVLRHLIAKQAGLEKFGYVTTPPSTAAIAKAFAGVEAAKGYEKCDRCDSRFQVFPDRREEDGALTSGGHCLYHWGKRVLQSKDSSVGGASREKHHTCCNQVIGSSLGCTYATSHVFKVSDPARLALLTQFECTPDNANVPINRAVSFDCEMGYTSQGFELIRITAHAWPDGKQLLDVLVRPLGQILDLNTRWSGVAPEDFRYAFPYVASIASDQPPGPPLSGDDEVETRAAKRLPVVSSPMVARQLLFDLISPDTPLIGHSIENDLNVTRIVHPNIVDTVLLFPHGRGLPLRPALKTLAKNLLNRDIQTAGSHGHDSAEDAQATGDLVREQVRRKWQSMQAAGWKFEGNKLTPPTSVTTKRASDSPGK